MSFVTSIFARRMIQAANTADDGEALLLSIGLEPEGSMDVKQVILTEAYYDLLERIAAEMPDANELPLRAGNLMRPDDYGALGLAWKSAPTVRHSLERVERYCRLWTDNLTYEIRDVEGGADFILHRFGDRRLGMRLSNEATIASATSLIRQTSSTAFRPRAVYLQHAAPKETSAHEHFFGCPIHFSSDRDALSISAESLTNPNHLGDDAISGFLTAHLDAEIAAISEEEPLETLIRRAVSRSLSAGAPKMADIAQRLAMSERTLHRRLTEKDLSFKTLVETTRQQLAQNLLGQSQYTMSEIAFLTGYSEQSAFQRAFKRWTGETPAAFRKTRNHGGLESR